jgi:hypothetical protein
VIRHPDDPGYPLLDFERDVLQWYSLRGMRASLADERPIFETGRM